MFSIKVFDKLLDLYFSKISRVDLAKKSASLGVVISVFLIIIKFIAWLSTKSISLQASMMDSLLDALASFFVFHALKYSDVKFDTGHNFGHEKVEGIAAIFQCLLIFYSGTIILNEAYEVWQHPEPMQNTFVGIIVMVVSTVATYQLVYFQKYAADRTDSMLVKGDSLHYSSDFFMNLGVITSLAVSSVFPHVDAIFGTVVGCYVLYNAFLIMKNALIDLMDESLPRKARDEINKVIKSVPEVKKVITLRTRSAGMKKYIETTVQLNGKFSFVEADKITNIIEKNLSKLYEKVDIIVKAVPDKSE